MLNDNTRLMGMDSQAPRVSIVIPAYNCEQYIAQAISSILNQTEPSLEIIIADDYSTDSTLDVVRRFQDTRIIVLEAIENKGPSYTRNRAIKAARGEWIALLDADDWYECDRIEGLLNVADKEAADMVMDPIFLIRDNEKRPWAIRGAHGTDDNTEISPLDFVANDYGTLKPLIKRKFLLSNHLRFPTEFRYGEDFVLYFRCLLHGAKLILTSTPKYYYRSHQGSLVAQGVATWEGLYQSNLSLLSDPKVIENAALYESLQSRSEDILSNINYCSDVTMRTLFIKHIKHGDIRKAYEVFERNKEYFHRMLLRTPFTIVRYFMQLLLSIFKLTPKKL